MAQALKCGPCLFEEVTVDPKMSVWTAWNICARRVDEKIKDTKHYVSINYSGRLNCHKT
ncbi:hypothetical protein DPMN_066332 [Dreissena polymorpha]|uniref:Uncharacterized protein n=1 Tax=Dreissena polymorpha TaxID=45954 RepID=A0A9D3YXL6_DREPO|nr:hypothetical protein DPMN_066332 [Dreissena polymorpha]